MSVDSPVHPCPRCLALPSLLSPCGSEELEVAEGPWMSLHLCPWFEPSRPASASA